MTHAPVYIMLYFFTAKSFSLLFVFNQQQQGGSADEGVMIGILSTIAPPFNRDQIKAQALWAATQAVLLIQEHKVNIIQQY